MFCTLGLIDLQPAAKAHVVRGEVQDQTFYRVTVTCALLTRCLVLDFIRSPEHISGWVNYPPAYVIWVDGCVARTAGRGDVPYGAYRMDLIQVLL